MNFKREKNELKKHDGRCPLCNEQTWIENENVSWGNSGELFLQIMCNCGFELLATYEIKDVNCSIEILEELNSRS